MAGPLSPFGVSLGGINLSCIADPTGRTDAGLGYSGTFAAAESSQAFVKRDMAVYLRRFSRGAGFVERRDAGDDDGYAWGENIDTWSGNGVRPAGRRQNVGFGYGLGVATSTVIDSAIFQGHLFAIAQSGHCIRWSNCDPRISNVPVHDPAINYFGSPSESFHPGYRPKAIAVFQDAPGSTRLMVSASHYSSGDTRMYQRDPAGVWSASPVLVVGPLAYRADYMAVTWWEGRDGVGAERLHIAHAGDSIIRHCIAGSNPLLAASYVTPIDVGKKEHPITALVAAPGHLYCIKKNGVHDINEIHSWNQTPYWEDAASMQYPSAALIYDDHLYAGRGMDLDRMDLRAEGLQQRIPGACGPGFLWQDGTPLIGYITDLASHDGWLLAALYNPYNGVSYVMRAKDRRIANIDVPNPLVWHGAEQAITDGDVLINHIRVTPNAATTYGQLSSYLWMFSTVGYAGTPYCDLYYAPLPTGGGALSLRVSGGFQDYHPTAKLYMTAQQWDDRSANKGVHRIDVVGDAVGPTTTIEIKTRSDGRTETITDESTWISRGTLTGNVSSIVTSFTGHSIGLQAILTTPPQAGPPPSAYYTAPILHELSPRAHVVREALEVRTLWIVLEQDHELRHTQTDIRSISDVFAQVAALQNVATTSTFVDELGESHQVYVEQGVRFARTEVASQGSVPEYRTVARLELSLVS